MLKVLLCAEASAELWGENALISYQSDAATIHYAGDYPLRRIQQAARRLQSQGVQNIQLEGDNWSYERQWAFYCGYTSPKASGILQWASIDEDELELLNARRHCADWLRKVVNATPDEMYPEQLADEVTQFLTGIAGDKISSQKIVGDELLNQGWVGIHSVGRASQRPPVMLTIDYNPTGDDNAPVSACLVGKGITFDSGGYSLKSSVGMLAMKSDNLMLCRKPCCGQCL